VKSPPSKPDASTASFEFDDEDFPTPFKFTLQMSKDSLMVIDLQDVFTVRPNGTRVYKLTDPGIHKSKQRFRKWTFGRTGKKGTGLLGDVCTVLVKSTLSCFVLQ